MAKASLYQDDDSPPITDINVTPFVDVALVLLVVFMVTAKLIVANGVEIEKPQGTGGQVAATLRVSVTADGKIYVNDKPYPTDAAAVERIEEIAAAMDQPKALITGDKRAAYGGVMHAITLVQEAKVTAIALENEQP